ncbi:MAG TPA: MBL fold metallo-hydrolase RNA specificity domain-containing protein, partial [Parafilimonas sp.]|nr:MBL fold metallo-hydrolase RNA specificity domain-containing protein [Parafilimonas sp.]
VGVMRSMSAHGDYKDLLHFLDCQKVNHVKKTFIVHGEYDVQQDFREKLMQKGLREVYVPERHQQFVLNE